VARKIGTGETQRIPGLYQREYEEQVRLSRTPDPRLWPVETGWPTSPVEYQKLVDASPCAQAAKRRVEVMGHGEAVEIAAPSWRSPLVAGIPWLAEPYNALQTITVTPDDTVRPAAYS